VVIIRDVQLERMAVGDVRLRYEGGKVRSVPSRNPYVR
jgi:hypothetical protein